MHDRINQLAETSRQVLLDCCLENGAIVAANSTKPYYPKEAKNYFYVWPRDASFACIAADHLGLQGIQEKFFTWLSERAEGWGETGLFYEKYYPNGLQALNRFQPDQTGTVLYAVWHHFRSGERAMQHKKLILHSANGICKAWKKDHFSVVTNDLWEERLAFPDLKENFSYSLAACSKGLECANLLFPKNRYLKTAGDMKAALSDACKAKGYAPRSFGKLGDDRIDASALGLVWPFEAIGPKDALAAKTIQLIEKKLAKGAKVHRYEHDEYDGWMLQTMHRKKGAGYWPLLNLWMGIALNRMGHKRRAMSYYSKAISATDTFIPEQVFDNNIQISVSPLAWSHAMFIIATKELGLWPRPERAQCE